MLMMMVGWHWIVDRRGQVSCIGEIGEMARQKLALYNYTPPPICMNGGRHAAPVVVGTSALMQDDNG